MSEYSITITPTTESSDSEKAISKFSYHFGIDEIYFDEVILDNNMCFISEDIDIGSLDKDEYIQLSATYDSGDNGSIEFYILDGSEARPIMPIEDSIVINEKIFYGLIPRFSIDESEEMIIKKNGSVMDISLNNAIKSNEDGLTITYTPLDAYNLIVNNYTIQVKAILRTYDKTVKAPSIKNISIRKYGRSLLWSTDI